jgi:hypothetical protein
MNNLKLREAGQVLLFSAALSPLIFFVVAVQYSALTYPFWDHCEFIAYFVKIHDHRLALRDLWAPHNHARPLIFRLIILANGMLTDWDVRSEFIYLIGSVLAAFAIQVAGLRSLCGQQKFRSAALIALLSTFIFSPAGHNNHWWSFMFDLTLAQFFIVAAFFLVCFRPRNWMGNIMGALACWLATYTLTNGLVAFAAAAVTVQLASGRPFRVGKVTVFWGVNIAAVLAVYLPNLAESHGGFNGLFVFTLACLGSPLSCLLSFPFKNMFDVPLETTRNAFVGALLLGFDILLFVAQRKKIASGEPAALLFACYSFFAIGSALLTGWGRAAVDAVGVANANASRYTIFSAFLIYAFLFVATQKTLVLDFPARFQRAFGRRLFSLCTAIGLAIFVGLAARSYAKSVAIYIQAHEFNKRLAAAYMDNDPAQQSAIYPNPLRLLQMKEDLRLLHIGPYFYQGQNLYLAGASSEVTDQLATHKVVDQFGIDGLRTLPAEGKVLFAQPNSRFELPLAAKTKYVRFRFGIAATAILTTPPTSGVLFRAILRDKSQRETVVWSRVLRPTTELVDRTEQAFFLPLNLSETATLVLETLPVESYGSCWAYWKNVEIDQGSGERN